MKWGWLIACGCAVGAAQADGMASGILVEGRLVDGTGVALSNTTFTARSIGYTWFDPQEFTTDGDGYYSFYATGLNFRFGQIRKDVHFALSNHTTGVVMDEANIKAQRVGCAPYAFISDKAEFLSSGAAVESADYEFSVQRLVFNRLKVGTLNLEQQMTVRSLDCTFDHVCVDGSFFGRHTLGNSIFSGRATGYVSDRVPHSGTVRSPYYSDGLESGVFQTRGYDETFDFSSAGSCVSNMIVSSVSEYYSQYGSDYRFIKSYNSTNIWCALETVQKEAKMFQDNSSDALVQLNLLSTRCRKDGKVNGAPLTLTIECRNNNGEMDFRMGPDTFLDIWQELDFDTTRSGSVPEETGLVLTFPLRAGYHIHLKAEYPGQSDFPDKYVTMRETWKIYNSFDDDYYDDYYYDDDYDRYGYRSERQGDPFDVRTEYEGAVNRLWIGAKRFPFGVGNE